MISQKSESYLAPSVQARVMELNNNGDVPPTIIIENIGTAASASIVIEESDDGTTWTPLAGTTKAINPGKSCSQIITSVKRKLALSAGGNVRLLVTVIRQVNGPVNDLGTA